MKKITLKRIFNGENYTIGKLYLGFEYICDTLEDKNRGLTSEMSEDEIKSKKVPGETAIPSGVYKIDLDTISPKFSKYRFYQLVCGGKLPRLRNVKGFEGILIHCGTTDENTHGCILVGDNTAKGILSNSKQRFEELYNKIKFEKQLEIEII